jgi:hypothetical protein
MKKHLVTSFFVLYTILSQAQWQSDARLTNATGNSYTSYNNAWCIAASGNVVHVVWYDDRNGYWQIYYKRSTDSGVNWGTETQLTNISAHSRYPSLAVSGSIVHVVWRDDRDGNDEIYYKSSADGGVSWGADTRLTNNPSGSYYPCVSVSGQDVHVVWQDYRDGNYEIYYKHSTNAGVSWGADTRLTSYSSYSENPSVSISGQFVHVVWRDQRDGNYEIYHKRSTDAGVSWGADTRLTNNPADSRYASVSVSGSVVHVVWQDLRDGIKEEIYYKRSTDGGINWGADTRLTNNTFFSEFPSVSVSGSVVHVVWEDDRDGNTELYYKCSTDGGTNWGADTRLTNNPAFSRYSSVSASGSSVHIVWEDSRDGNYEIYYKRDSTGNITGIENTGSELPVQFTLEQNYPNPFNQSTSIQYVIGSRQFVQLKVYDVLGNEIATLVNEEKSVGSYEINFNARSLSSGIYFYNLQAGSFVEIRKMILIK